MPLGMEVNLSPGDVVLDGVAAPPPYKGHSLQFSVHVYCGQTAGWMKTPLGTVVDLSPGHIVLDGDPAPPRKGHSSPTPLFGPCLLWPRSPISATAELLSLLMLVTRRQRRDVSVEELHVMGLVLALGGPEPECMKCDLLWSPYVIGQTIIFLPCDFYLSSFFSSPNLRLDVYHTSTHGVALVQI